MDVFRPVSKVTLAHGTPACDSYGKDHFNVGATAEIFPGLELTPLD